MNHVETASNPLREVCLDDFLISKYEITFREYDLFTQETGRAARNDVGFGREGRPVIDVSWFDAFAYAEWLSNKTGKTYRLPTDAEWEFTARFDTEFGYKYTWGAEEELGKANCSDCGSQWDGKMTAPVGSFEPNTLGVYDLHGNVWEWTADCYYADSPKEEEGSHCKSGVVRGGSWDVNAGHFAFWIRAPQLSGKPTRDTGFRLVMEP